MHAGPLVAVTVHARLEEAPATLAAALLEGIGEFRKQAVDFLAMLFDSLGVEADGTNDTFCHDVVAGVLASLVEAVDKDGLDVLRGKNAGFRGHD